MRIAWAKRRKQQSKSKRRGSDKALRVSGGGRSEAASGGVGAGRESAVVAGVSASGGRRSDGGEPERDAPRADAAANGGG